MRRWPLRRVAALIRPVGSLSDWTIKRTYRRLIRECHPDVTDYPDAAERAKHLNVAFDLIGDPKLRAAFDNDLGNVLEGWTDKRHYWLWRTEWCLQCGVELHRGLGDATHSPRWRSKRHDARYCSNACRQRAYRARKAALAQLGPGRDNADP